MVLSNYAGMPSLLPSETATSLDWRVDDDLAGRSVEGLNGNLKVSQAAFLYIILLI